MCITGEHDERPTGPVDFRAWIMQEQLLSTRILHYTADEIYWECLHHSVSESYPHRDRVSTRGLGTKLWELQLFKTAITSEP
jgi:hypothetical protein